MERARVKVWRKFKDVQRGLFYSDDFDKNGEHGDIGVN